jgi:hypothetical protein
LVETGSHKPRAIGSNPILADSLKNVLTKKDCIFIFSKIRSF